MTIVFTENEMKHIVKDFFNWHVADNCPKHMREDIQEKLDALRNFAREMKNNGRASQQQRRTRS